MDILNILEAKIEENNVVDLTNLLHEETPHDRENLIRKLQKNPKYKVYRIVVEDEKSDRKNQTRTCKIFAAKKELPVSTVMQIAREQKKEK